MIIVIAVVFSALAALIAFLITYQEYAHHYSSTKEPLRVALEAAGFTFVVFVVLAVFAGLLLQRMTHEHG